MRNKEAVIIRNDEATLPTGGNPTPASSMSAISTSAAALVFNDTGTQSVSAYQTLTAVSPSAQGQPIDPLNYPQNNNQTWANNSTFKSIMTDSTSSLRYRDDLQLMTANVFNGTGPLKYIAGSLHAFGNNNSTSFGGSVTTTSNTCA